MVSPPHRNSSVDLSQFPASPWQSKIMVKDILYCFTGTNTACFSPRWPIINIYRLDHSVFVVGNLKFYQSGLSILSVLPQGFYALIIKRSSIFNVLEIALDPIQFLLLYSIEFTFLHPHVPNSFIVCMNFEVFFLLHIKAMTFFS